MEVAVCLRQACNELCRADLIFCDEHEWRYHIGGIGGTIFSRNRNVGHIKTEIKDRGGIF